MADHTLYKHVLHSLARWGVAFCLAAGAGIAYGLIAGWCRTVERITIPIIHVLQLIPGLAWIPALTGLYLYKWAYVRAAQLPPLS